VAARLEPGTVRWAAQAVERCLHMARIIMTRAAAWPVAEAPFPAHTLNLAEQLYEEVPSSRRSNPGD
jgi:hypothetical protein